MKLNIYGKKIEIIRYGENWKVFYLGNEGKKRIADDIVIPESLKEEELKDYIQDLFHEWSIPSNNQIIEID